MFPTLNKTLLLVDNKLKKQLILIYFLSIIGTFLETLGIGIILPILKVIIEGEEFIKNFSSNYLIINSFLEYLLLKNYEELIVFLLLTVILVFFNKNMFFSFFNK